ncbi:MAG: OsmC family protein [Hyphomicrobiaceae bacterium]
MGRIDSIEGSGFPLGFEVQSGTQRPAVLGNRAAEDVFIVEARMLQGHQREGIVKEGANGSTWRLTCDEGKHLKGTDLAPFPLGYFNAGLHSDLIGRIQSLAQTRSIMLDQLNLDLQNHYWLTGSFFKGDGEGFSDPATATVKINSKSSPDDIRSLIDDAIKASPAMAAMRLPLTNTFALYSNGRRRTIDELAASDAGNASDPYVTYNQPPKPLAEWADNHTLVQKLDVEERGEITPAQNSTDTRIIRNVRGRSQLLDSSGIVETETWLGLPGMTHFALKSDERSSAAVAPCGMTLQAAGIAFCFMTQLGRYIEHMKFDIEGIRMVQYSPYALVESDRGLEGIARPVDTHLFLNGRADEETFGRLMHIAARTCYLHATLGATLPPQVDIELNGARI